MDTETSPTTRRVTLSSRKIANMGPRYWNQFLGLTVVWTGWDGAARTGTLESFTSPLTGAVGHPIVRFPDGTWARAGVDLTVVGADR